ncbi:hypothetical protein MPL3365_30308 [Mesorhizobium plurifarium]|uniref:Uncharacterized protein n=1 Tax=Mesorhizobium plurifarium TaxID=69974 RepID=A0A090GEB3_MESPL|nr:hypothetical protein MPL3365_30308 [Mesorhizobium plurifarium]
MNVDGCPRASVALFERASFIWGRRYHYDYNAFRVSARISGLRQTSTLTQLRPQHPRPGFNRRFDTFLRRRNVSS